MSAPDVFVHTELAGETHLVGHLWIREDRRGGARASFQYADQWLDNTQSFAIDPGLLPTIASGPYHKARLFGAIADSAPDRWGRTLMARGERLQAKHEDRAVRHLGEIDYVLGVSDIARQGALRFTVPGRGDFLSPSSEPSIPPIVDLPKLLAAAHGFLNNPDNEDDLRVLLAPGSSLGGARPKASVRDSEGRLALAKFPKKDDLHSVEAWEHLALTMAREAGILVANSELITVDDQDVLLLERFDRRSGARIPFLSAMSMLDGVDLEPRSYLEIAEVVRRFGSSTRADLHELWRRMVFNVLVTNTDDHLRNHGFLYAGEGGWTLSPAYDLNPVPIQLKPRFMSTALGEDPHDTTASLQIAFDVADYFDLDEDEARFVASEVAAVVATWADRASAMGIGGSHIDFMSSAFEHGDLTLALDGR